MPTTGALALNPRVFCLPLHPIHASIPLKTHRSSLQIFFSELEVECWWSYTLQFSKVFNVLTPHNPKEPSGKGVRKNKDSRYIENHRFKSRYGLVDEVTLFHLKDKHKITESDDIFDCLAMGIYFAGKDTNILFSAGTGPSSISTKQRLNTRSSDKTIAK